MIPALRDGFRAVRHNWGTAVFVLAVNLAAAALLALPLASALERDLAHTGASVDMMYGFDHTWWKEWQERQTGWTASFGPEILGAGFAAKNLDLLLHGELPLGWFRAPREAGDDGGEPVPPSALDPVVLGLAAAYLVVQTCLLGGLLGVFRAPQGGWTVRGLLHGSGFYAGRLVRVMLLAVALAGVVFWLNAPLTRLFDGQAREAVSETAAIAWSLGRYLLLLFALVLVHMVSSYAKVVVVLEERSSAFLAFLTSAGFCWRHLGRALGQYAVVAGLGVALLAAWTAVDARLGVTGYRTQLRFLLLAQAFLLARVYLRLSLLAGQVALYQRLGRPA
jgi:hypothetical protein